MRTFYDQSVACNLSTIYFHCLFISFIMPCFAPSIYSLYKQLSDNCWLCMWLSPWAASSLALKNVNFALHSCAIISATFYNPNQTLCVAWIFGRIYLCASCKEEICRHPVHWRTQMWTFFELACCFPKLTKSVVKSFKIM